MTDPDDLEPLRLASRAQERCLRVDSNGQPWRIFEYTSQPPNEQPNEAPTGLLSSTVLLFRQ